ncbi:substrate-binding domain-containing protein [Klebsiella pneumoniae]|uniref:Substrate-binding domain-containing protein n=1 Tax=Klebsiella pneumoniae TaxID=573 RepID=A0A939NLX4_KLEPN|nr:substrate-binding domain-containing protein [Klebsiella pneumoniae]
MANTTLTLLAAGSLRSAFLPLVAHFRQHTGSAVDGPCRLLRERIEAGAPCAVFASARRTAQALLQAGLAQECRICQQPADADRPAVAGQRWLDWLALLSTPRLRLATSTPGCDPSGDYTGSCSPELRHAIGVGQRDGRAGAAAGRRQRLTERAAGRDSRRVAYSPESGGSVYRLCALWPRAGRLRRSAYPDHPAPWNIRCDYQLARLRADPPRWPCIALSSATLVRGISGRRVLCRSATQRKPRRQQRNAEAAWRIRRTGRPYACRRCVSLSTSAVSPPATGLRQQKQRMAGHL